MSDLTKTIKLRIHVSPEQGILFQQMTEQYRQACNFVSQYIFDNQFNLAYQSLNKELYKTEVVDVITCFHHYRIPEVH